MNCFAVRPLREPAASAHRSAPSQGAPSKRNEPPTSGHEGPTSRNGGSATRNEGSTARNDARSSRNGPSSSRNEGSSSRNGRPTSSDGDQPVRNEGSSLEDDASSKADERSFLEGESPSKPDGGPSLEDEGSFKSDERSFLEGESQPSSRQVGALYGAWPTPAAARSSFAISCDCCATIPARLSSLPSAVPSSMASSTSTASSAWSCGRSPPTTSSCRSITTRSTWTQARTAPMTDDLEQLLASLRLFVRYADDCNVYVRSRRAGERVMQALRGLCAKLRLRVNEKKSGRATAGPQVPRLQLLVRQGRRGPAAGGSAARPPSANYGPEAWTPRPRPRWRRSPAAGGSTPTSPSTSPCASATSTRWAFPKLAGQPYNRPNRRMRTRTSGGVGGEQRLPTRLCPLSRSNARLRDPSYFLPFLLKVSFMTLEGMSLMTVLAGIFTGSPVWGLRPMRALRSTSLA